MAFTKNMIFLFALALLALPIGFLEMFFDITSFADFMRNKENRWTRWIHVAWCYVMNSRYAFIFGGLLWALSPIIFIISSFFSIGVFLAQVLHDRLVKGKRMTAAELKELKKKRRSAFIPKKTKGEFSTVDKEFEETMSEAEPPKVTYTLPSPQ